MNNPKEHFLEEVLQCIKSKDAKEVVYKELSHHLKMSKLELVTKGANEKEAEEKAIRQMGSPTELGTHFNKLYRPLFDWKLFSLFLIIISMGILPILNVQDSYSWNLLARQIIYIVLGIFVTIFVMLIDYRKIKRLGWLFLIVASGLLLAINYFPNVIINGVSYIRILSFTISGTTLLPLFLVFWAFYFSKEKPNLLVVIGVYLLSLFFFMRLPSLPDVFIYTMLVLSLFICSSLSKRTKYTTIGAAFGLFVVLLFVTATEYQWSRLQAYLHPEDFAQNAGYMYLMLKNLLASGGWFGNETPPQYVVEMSTDFAFANIVYFYGWIISGIVIVLLLLLVYRLIMVSSQIKDPFGKQLIIGVSSLLSIQFIYNIGMILGFLPIISMSLPFISYGLTPTVFSSLLIGMVLSVYRRKHLIVSHERHSS